MNVPSWPAWGGMSGGRVRERYYRRGERDEEGSERATFDRHRYLGISGTASRSSSMTSWSTVVFTSYSMNLPLRSGTIQSRAAKHRKMP